MFPIATSKQDFYCLTFSLYKQRDGKMEISVIIYKTGCLQPNYKPNHSADRNTLNLFNHVLVLC